MIVLAAVAGAHGIKGEVRLKLFTDHADKLKQLNVRVGGVDRRVLSLASAGKTPIVRFEGISSRDDAEALRGSLVEVERSALPPLEEGEYYHADVIGLPAVDRAGQPIGKVAAVENFGAGDLLEIELEGGKLSLIPFREGIADLGEGRIILDTEFLA